MSDIMNAFIADTDQVMKEMGDPRIHSIDVLKGISIILVITAHSAYFWVTPEWYWLYGMIYMLLDVFGPSMFMFLSALGVVFSVKSKQEIYPGEAIRSRIVRRAAVLIVIGMIYNLILQMVLPIPWILKLWGWSIIFAIGFAQVFTYLALKLSRFNRVILAFIIIYIGPALHNVLRSRFASPLPTGGWDHYPIDSMDDFVNGYAVFFFILYQMASMEPLLPWAAYSLIGSIIGEMLLDAIDKGTKQDYEVFQREILFLGIFLTIGGIIAGLNLTTETFGFPTLAIINGETALQAGVGSPLHLSAIPEFLVHGSTANMIYNLGVALLLEALFFALLELREKRGKAVFFFEFYGKLSLTIFFLHQILIGLFGYLLGWAHSLGMPWYFVADAFLVLLVGGIMAVWVFKGKATGTLEWMVIVLGQIQAVATQRMSKRKRRKERD
ncbi:MAG: heparan-alpha-glucosaminide N-acetyltransferase domain-containing protein [Promethearchaeota archaeon]